MNWKTTKQNKTQTFAHRHVNLFDYFKNPGEINEKHLNEHKNA